MINQLTAGTTLDFSTRVDQYPAPVWTLTYYLRGLAVLDLVAAASGTGFRVQATPAQTATLNATGAPVTYGWVARVVSTLTGEAYDVGSGDLVVLPNLAAQPAGYDGRSQAQIALAQAKAALASFNASGGLVQSYSINGRTMTYASRKDLLEVVHYWQTIVRNEMTAESIANGLGNPRKLYVRFAP